MERKTILLVTPIVTFKDYLAAFLRQKGCEVMTCQTAAKALARLMDIKHPLDLILTDWKVRDEEDDDATGLLVTQAAAQLPDRIPKVIILTPDDPEAARAALADRGFDELVRIVHRPIPVPEHEMWHDFADLGDLIEEALARSPD